MAGSFESGAGDDPDDLFGSDDDSEEKADAEAVTETDRHQDDPSETADSATPETKRGEESESTSNADTSLPDDASDSGESKVSQVMLEFETPREIDAAHLAREFVPNTYEKPHAWALGRDGVNDGRSEKKTFFLQSRVLKLETACSQEVNKILDGDVPLTDLRELALIIAYHQPELLAEAAREWGSESA